jgi:predicted nuclease of predicted toxin-antitoxin system
VRLYLDQMLRFELASLLREAGHDVVRASEIGQARADDDLILKRAVQEGRILISLDGHFGDWAVLPLSQHFGVIRVKVHPTSTENVAKILLPLLANYSPVDFTNKLVIASRNRIRWIQTSEE